MKVTKITVYVEKKLSADYNSITLGYGIEASLSDKEQRDPETAFKRLHSATKKMLDRDADLTLRELKKGV